MRSFLAVILRNLHFSAFSTSFKHAIYSASCRETKSLQDELLKFVGENLKHSDFYQKLLELRLHILDF